MPAPTGHPAQPSSRQQEIDWAKRYSDLQPEYTRATQELAEMRQQQELYDALLSTEDPDTRREIAQQLGYVLEDEDDDDPVRRDRRGPARRL